MPTTTAPTEKQVAYLRKLLAEREGVEAAELVRQALNTARDARQLTRATVSAAIESLLLIKRPQGASSGSSCQGMAAYEQAQPGDLLYVPEGHYATPSRTGANDLDFWRVDRPAEGRWAGRVFVKRVIGGRADQAVRGAEAVAALQAITADHPHHAMVLYGQEIGRCGRCNRHLTDDASRARGLGPDCAGMV